MSMSNTQGLLITYVHMSSTTHRKLSLVLVEKGNRTGNLIRIGRLKNTKRLQVGSLFPVMCSLNCVVCRVSSEQEVWVQDRQLIASTLGARACSVVRGGKSRGEEADCSEKMRKCHICLKMEKLDVDCR